jgi:radical SAM superfamily enzyme
MLLPPETVIARLSADAEREILLAPLWTRNKRAFENELDRIMRERGLTQGMLYK